MEPHAALRGAGEQTAMTDYTPDPFHDALIAKISAAGGGVLYLHCVRDKDGHIEPPRGADLTMRFTVAELRAIGVDVQIKDADGNLMTDQQYIDMLIACDTLAAGCKPTLAVTT